MFNKLHNPDIGTKSFRCASPRYILNPSYVSLLSVFNKYYIFNQLYFYRQSAFSVFDTRLKKRFNQYCRLVNDDNVNSCFILDEDTGETYPLFIPVKCGHCASCRRGKMDDIVGRMYYESQMYDCAPYFFTLTYDNDHLPKEGVNVRDIQLFMKRLRKNLDTVGYTRKIRYFIVSEYGPKTLRPHYHGIIWNYVPDNLPQLLDLRSFMEKAWKNGEVRRPRYIDMSQGKRTFKYSSGYLSKGSVVPEGFNNVFRLSSRGNGGIGAPFYDKIRREFNRSLDPKFMYVDKFTGTVKRLSVCQYALNRLLPSYSRSVSSKLRTAVTKFCVSYRLLEDFGLSMELEMLYGTFVNRLKQRFSKYLDLPFRCSTRLVNVSRGTLFSYLDDCQRIIEPFFKKTINFDRAVELDKKRKLYLSRMSSYADALNYDRVDYEYKSRNVLNRLTSNCVL